MICLPLKQRRLGLQLIVDLDEGTALGLVLERPLREELVPLRLDEVKPPAEVCGLEVRAGLRAGVLLVLLLEKHALEIQQVEGLLLGRERLLPLTDFLLMLSRCHIFIL